MFRSPVSAQFPHTAQLVLQDVVTSTVEEDGLANLLLAQRASPFPQTYKAKSRAHATAVAGKVLRSKDLKVRLAQIGEVAMYLLTLQ